MRLYTIRDTTRELCMPPVACDTDGHAWREYDRAISNDQYARDHTDEYELYYIADWFPETGEVITLQTGPEKLYRTLKNQFEEATT
jgi:hypothetical protein